MSEKLTTFVYNGLTGQQESRELTSSEVLEIQELRAAHLEAKAEEEARLVARQSALAKLAALGLTEEEIAAL
ncbi:hypothetical protein UFOVP419_51 [uncultured Caudovirales phage]|uniref:Uncharacterized protein n=1 Tax=uncultured Caudovirales phage TaxID=2100421 RepID=A0A6J5M9W9_9CAUD|nr:hypothetical protein UFOVP419_51 [uncultured Caudovirales phage]